jgi:hypothetical protein
MNLDELCDLAIREKGIFSLTISDGECSASFKVPGRRTEVVRDRIGYECTVYRAGRVLDELLVRLGYRSLPTLDRICTAFKPREVERLKELLQEARAIREAARQRLIVNEPRHASPRSSLGKHMTLEAEHEKDHGDYIARTYVGR